MILVPGLHPAEGLGSRELALVDLVLCVQSLIVITQVKK